MQVRASHLRRIPLDAAPQLVLARPLHRLKQPAIAVLHPVSPPHLLLQFRSPGKRKARTRESLRTIPLSSDTAPHTAPTASCSPAASPRASRNHSPPPRTPAALRPAAG